MTSEEIQHVRDAIVAGVKVAMEEAKQPLSPEAARKVDDAVRSELGRIRPTHSNPR